MKSLIWAAVILLAAITGLVFGASQAAVQFAILTVDFIALMMLTQHLNTIFWRWWESRKGMSVVVVPVKKKRGRPKKNA